MRGFIVNGSFINIEDVSRLVPAIRGPMIYLYLKSGGNGITVSVSDLTIRDFSEYVSQLKGKNK